MTTVGMVGSYRVSSVEYRVFDVGYTILDTRYSLRVTAQAGSLGREESCGGMNGEPSRAECKAPRIG